MSIVFKKLGMLLSLLWVAVTLNFFLPHMMPGNPAENLIARMKGHANPQAMHALLIQFGLVNNKPLWVQYFQYLNQILHGQFGISIQYYPVNVTRIIAESLPWTLCLVGVATILAFILGTLIGVVAAWRRNKWFDSIQGLLWMFLGSVPQFWLALLLLYYFGFQKGWLPMVHSYDSTDTPALNLHFIGDALKHAILPGAALLVTSIGGWMLAMRNNMIQVVSDDYISFARAKGLKQRKIMMTYAARNAILPNITQLAIALGYAVGGQILIEQIFSYPGIGFQLANAVLDQDYSLAQGIFLIISVVMIVMNFIVDLLYTWLDPRVRTGEATM
jgi:peptide/nickel transport system permease protein